MGGVPGPGAGSLRLPRARAVRQREAGGALLHARRGREPAAPEPRGADPAPGPRRTADPGAPHERRHPGRAPGRALRPRAWAPARGARRLARARAAHGAARPCPSHRCRFPPLRRPVHRAALAVRSRHPMTAAPLDQRSRQVLLAVIAEYVETGEPVGSRAVARRHIRGLSPATIRNAMADLEELGYLVQPHTSAGRVPTDAAYRVYVDHLQRVPWAAGKAPAVGAPVAPHADAVERLMAETPSRLSADTHMMGVLLAPPLKHTALDRIELVALDEERALAVLVTETGWVTARPLTASPRGGGEELRETGRALTRRFRGKTFQEILDELAAPADPLDPLWTRSRQVIQEGVSLLPDRTLYTGGATNTPRHP